MIPRKIDNYLDYVSYQDSLWDSYKRARESTGDTDIHQAMSDVYQKLMRHLEAAYYKKLCGRGLLSDDEIVALRQKLLPVSKTVNSSFK